VTLAIAALAFAGGYVPKELELRDLRATMKTTDLDLRLANLHRQLGVASEEAQRNNFASAATAARAFFAGCRTIAQDEAFAEQPRTRTAISAYAGYEDDIILRLTNADPSVKEKLGALYLAMQGVLDRRL
jgi:hypothetical protein